MGLLPALVAMLLLLFVTVSAAQELLCEERQYRQTRNRYEECASEKVKLLEEQQQENLCRFVQQMMDQCGEELQKCFSQEQISTTKRKQEEQLALALSAHFPDFGSKCLEASSDNAIIDKIVPSEMNNADNRRLGKTVEIDTSQLSQRPSSAGGATTWPLAILF